MAKHLVSRGKYYVIVRKNEPIGLLESARSLSVYLLITVIINLIKYAKFSIIDTRTQLLKIEIKPFYRINANFEKQLSKIGLTGKGKGKCGLNVTCQVFFRESLKFD